MVEDGMVWPLSTSEIEARLHAMIGYEAGAEELAQIAALLQALSPLTVADPVFAEPATAYRAKTEPET